MIVSLGKGSLMDTKVVLDKEFRDMLVTVRPRKFSKLQKKTMLFPFYVSTEGADGGKLVDQGYILVDLRTGRLSIEHRMNELPIEDTTTTSEGITNA